MLGVIKLVAGFFSSIFTAIFDFATRNPKTTAAILGAIALGWLHLHLVDRAVTAAVAKNDAEWQERQAAANLAWEAKLQDRRIRVAALILEQQAVNAINVAAAKAREEKFADELKQRLKEVPRYVTPLADSRCIVSAGFVRHVDAAIASANRAAGIHGPEPAEALPEKDLGLVDADSGISLSIVDQWAQRVIDVGKRWKARALECDAWVDQQEQVFNQPKKESAP